MFGLEDAFSEGPGSCYRAGPTLQCSLGLSVSLVHESFSFGHSYVGKFFELGHQVRHMSFQLRYPVSVIVEAFKSGTYPL